MTGVIDRFGYIGTRINEITQRLEVGFSDLRKYDYAQQRLFSFVENAKELLSYLEVMTVPLDDIGGYITMLRNNIERKLSNYLSSYISCENYLFVLANEAECAELESFLLEYKRIPIAVVIRRMRAFESHGAHTIESWGVNLRTKHHVEGPMINYIFRLSRSLQEDLNKQSKSTTAFMEQIDKESSESKDWLRRLVNEGFVFMKESWERAMTIIEKQYEKRLKERTALLQELEELEKEFSEISPLYLREVFPNGLIPK